MKKKLGPLQTWQWLAVGAAIGLVYYIYRARQNATASNAGTVTPAPSTDLGPIDPTTGQPYALEGGGGAASGTSQNAGPTSLAQELSDLGAIQGLMAGFSQVQPTTGDGTIAGDGSTLPADVLGVPSSTPASTSTAVGAVTRAQKQLLDQMKVLVKQAQKAAAQAQHPKTNPGHAVTSHAGGKKSVSSSAPHNGQQHKNVAPPSHQRHNPTTHPSRPTGGPPAAPHPATSNAGAAILTHAAPHPEAPKAKPKPRRR